MKKQINLKELLESKTKAIKPVANSSKAMGDIKPNDDFINHFNINSVDASPEAIKAAEKAIPHNLMYYAESTEFVPETKAVAVTAKCGMSVDEAKTFNENIKRFVDEVLVSGVDYGVIPRCSKPSLLKSGAEKILTFLGLVARTEVVNRVEDYKDGFFAYEAKVFVIDEYTGIIKGVGIATANTKESKYIKGNGFNYQNVVLKMAKKRALVDAALNVANLSSFFTQDVEDMNLNDSSSSSVNEGKATKQPNSQSTATQPEPLNRPASTKQINFLTSLMKKFNTSANSLNKYTKANYGIEDYTKISSNQASELIGKFTALEKQ